MLHVGHPQCDKAKDQKQVVMALEARFPQIKFGYVDTAVDDGHLIEVSFDEKMYSANVYFVHTDATSGQRHLFKVHESATADDLEPTLVRLLEDPALLKEVLADT